MTTDSKGFDSAIERNEAWEIERIIAKEVF